MSIRLPQEVVVVDCETTGLDLARHEMYELAVVWAKPMVARRDTDEALDSERWLIKPKHLDQADAGALRLNNFYDIGWNSVHMNTTMVKPNKPTRPGQNWKTYAVAAREIAELLAGKYLVGSKPSFDADFIEKFLREHSQAPAWQHRMIDVASMAIMAFPELHGIPCGLTELTNKLEIEIPDGKRHTATGDAEATMLAYEKLREMARER